MNDQKMPVIEDHPRLGELDEIWDRLRTERPGTIEEMLTIDVVDVDFPLPLSFIDEAHVPSSFVGDRNADEIAFGLAYTMSLNPLQHAVDDAIVPMESEMFGAGTSMALAPLLGVAGGLNAVWRAVTRFAERERGAIEAAVEWVDRAGFDPNAGVKMFMSLSGWFDEHAANSPARENDEPMLKRLGLMAMFAPVVGAMSVPLSRDPPMTTAVDRAAAVRTAVVARGLHRR